MGRGSRDVEEAGPLRAGETMLTEALEGSQEVVDKRNV